MIEPSRCNHVVGWLHGRGQTQIANAQLPSRRLVRQSEIDDVISAHRSWLAQRGESYRRTFAMSDELVFALAVYHFLYCPICGIRLFQKHEGPEMGRYDQDFHRWLQQQANLLRERHFDQIDLPNLIEEVDSMRRDLTHELKDRMADMVRLRLLIHALPGEAWASHWKETIKRQRYMNRLILEDAPSLMDSFCEMIDDARETGRLRALEELAYVFPDRVFDDEFASMPPLKVEDFFE